MAVYKPTDCSPYNGTFDMTSDLPIWFECKVDTSNTKITGYSVEVYNSEGEKIFPKKFTIYYYPSSVTRSYIQINNIYSCPHVVVAVASFSSQVECTYTWDERYNLLTVTFSSTEVAQSISNINLTFNDSTDRSDYISLVSDLKKYTDVFFSGQLNPSDNSGVNGTYLKIPFIDIVRATSSGLGFETTARNKYDKNVESSSSIAGVIANGAEYSWNVTLYQEVSWNNVSNNVVLPQQEKYYDMSLTTGQVMGSNNERIQTVPVMSDVVLVDKQIQLGTITFDTGSSEDTPTSWSGSFNTNNAPSRNLITNYVNTTGYIYPSTATGNALPADLVTRKSGNNGFQVYKNGNDISNLGTTDMVSFVYNGNIRGSTTAVYNGITLGTWQWIPHSTTSSYSYWQQTVLRSSADDYNPLGVGTMSVGQRIILNHMASGGITDALSTYKGSPYNGIYYLKEREEEALNADHNEVGSVSILGTAMYYVETTYPIFSLSHISLLRIYLGSSVTYIDITPSECSYATGTLNKIILPSQYTYSTTYTFNIVYKTLGYEDTYAWWRATDADTWGELSNKVVYVEQGSFNGTPSISAGLNAEINMASNAGVLNSTPFRFEAEKPVKLYNYTSSLIESKTSTVVTSGSMYRLILDNNISQVTSITQDGSTLSPSLYCFGVETPYVYIQATTTGTYNVTYIPYNISDYTGIVFYNDPQGSSLSASNQGKLYIRPFTGLDSNMIFREITGSANPRWFSFDEINTDYWYVKYHFVRGSTLIDEEQYPFRTVTSGVYTLTTDNTIGAIASIKQNNSLIDPSNYSFTQGANTITITLSSETKCVITYASNSANDTFDIGSRYQIKSFYQKSDYNPFSLYANPTITTSLSYLDGTTVTPSSSIYTLTQQDFVASATYDQTNYIQWQSYQWLLYLGTDDSGELIEASPEGYDGEIKHTFYGLKLTESGESSHNYYLKLIIYTNSGAKIQQGISIVTNVTAQGSTSALLSAFSVDSSFNNSRLASQISYAFSPDTSGGTTYSNSLISIYRREIWYDRWHNGGISHWENKWHLVLTNQSIPSSAITIYDYNISNNRHYEYLYVLTSTATTGSTTSTIRLIKYSTLSTRWMGWSLTELHETDDSNIYTINSQDSWRFKYNISTGEYTQSIAKTQQDTLSQYPKFSHGPKNNISGSVSALLGKDFLPASYTTQHYYYDTSSRSWSVDSSDTSTDNLGGYKESLSRWTYQANGDISYSPASSVGFDNLTSNDSVDLMNAWREVCYSGNPKLLRDQKGQAFIVQIFDPSIACEDSWQYMPATTSFSWAEIDNVKPVTMVETETANFVVTQATSATSAGTIIYNGPTYAVQYTDYFCVITTNTPGYKIGANDVVVTYTDSGTVISDVSFNTTSGLLTIPASYVSGAITITSTTTIGTYTVTHNVTNCSFTGGSTATYGENYEESFNNVATRYSLDINPQITIGGVTLSTGYTYTYNRGTNTASLSILGSAITGNVVITVNPISSTLATPTNVGISSIAQATWNDVTTTTGGQSVTTTVTYKCYINDTEIVSTQLVTDSAGNILTDSDGNILTAT